MVLFSWFNKMLKKMTTGGDYSNMMSIEIKLLHVIWEKWLENGTLLRKVSITLKPDLTKAQIMFGKEWEPKSKHINCLCRYTLCL